MNSQKIFSALRVPVKCALSSLSVFFILYAETSTAQSNIQSQQVDVVKPYQPLLSNADKIDIKAQPLSFDTTHPTLQYHVTDHVIHVPFVAGDLKALAMPKDSTPSALNNLIRAGFGTQFTPVADIYLANGADKNFNYGIQFHHLSSSGNLDFQKFSTNNARLFGGSYVGSSYLSGGLNYDRDVHYFYGFDHALADSDFFPSKNNLKQTFQNGGVNVSVHNTKTLNGDWNYNASYQFNYAEKKPGDTSLTHATESLHHLQLDASKRFQQIHLFDLGIDYQAQILKSDTDTSLHFLHILPNYQLRWNGIYVKVGLNVDVLNKNTKVYPDIEASYNLLNNYVIPFAGFKGYRSPNTLSSIMNYNPFIGGFYSVPASLTEVYLGLRGGYGSNLTYTISMALENETNLPLYVPDSLQPVHYDVLYYYKARVFHFHGEVGFQKSDHISVALKGDVFNYHLDFDDKPWGLPTASADLTLDYQIQQKIFLKGDLFAHSGVYYILPDAKESNQLNAVWDANVSINYNYKPNIGFWLAFNNILNQKTGLWYQYPTYGAQALVGLNLKF